jgi:CRISPR-associated exonuclease Cas4
MLRSFAPNIDDIFKVGATVWVDDCVRTDVGRKGQGLQRALIFALVRSLAKLARFERDNARNRDETNEDIPSRQASQSSYFILEEPELYLHPQAQRELFDSLLQLSKGESQVLLCTHSSSFISLGHYSSICIVRKSTLEKGTTAFQCTEDLFPTTSQKDIFNMTYWINPDRGELFFARKVILTEGPSDKTVLPLLANRLGIFRHDYSVIDCGSKDSMPNYIHLLNKFKIPYVIVYDRDHQASKLPDAIESADIASAKVEAKVDNALGKSVILENNVEEELGMADPANKNKPYMALAHIQDSGFVISDSLRRKVETIYK